MSANVHTYTNPYNIVVQLVKLLLVALALYLLSLSTQLQTKFATTIVLVNATPKDQISMDRSFTVSLYALHFLSDYRSLQVRAFLVNPEGEYPLGSKRFGRLTVPFYSARFRLPSTYEPGAYRFRYDVVFDGKSGPRKPNITGCQVTYKPPPPPGVIRLGFAAPLIVRQGQRVPLPEEWGAMDVQPYSERQVSIETDGRQKRWLRARPRLGRGRHQIEFRSLMTVTDLDQKSRFVATETSRAHKAGRTIYWDQDTLFWRIGEGGAAARILPGQIELKSRISSICRREGSRYVASEVYVAPSELQAPDFTQTLIVDSNEEPRSAYDSDPRREVSLYSTWLFLDPARNLYYLNLNRYIIDPDGRNPATNDLDVRVSSLKMRSNDARFTLVPPSREAGYFRLYLTSSGYSELMSLRSGSHISIGVIATDEKNSPSLTLRIIKI